MTHAFVVDDNDSFRRFITLYLENHGFKVTALPWGQELLRHLKEQGADIVLLDRLLPDVDGFDLCENVKRNYPDLPLLMFSTAGEAQDVIRGLKIGADDYLPKPFPPEMLLAKIEAVCRRYKQPRPSMQTLKIGELSINPASHQVCLAGKKLHLTKSEYMILAALAETPGKVLERGEILHRVLGYSEQADYLETNVSFHLTAIRKKLGKFRDYIETVRGFGYRLCDPSQEPSVH